MAVTFLRSALAVARADFRERRRRYSFFLGFVFSAFLSYHVASGKEHLMFDDHRGLYTSAWVGMVMALLANSCTVIAFYLVKNSLDRDQHTRVGQILAATPLSNSAYVLGKLLSNFTVLASMLGVFAAGAPLVQLSLGEDRALQLWQLYAPLLLLSLPTMALTAAVALCFELLPVLRARVGNVAWLLFWVFAVTELARRSWLATISGAGAVRHMKKDAALHMAGYRGYAQFFIDVPGTIQIVKDWRWTGIHWTPASILISLGWLSFAFALPLLVMAVSFKRFDPAEETESKRGIKSALRAPAQLPALELDNAPLQYAGTPPRLTPLGRSGASGGFRRIFSAELHLAYSGYRWWWYAVALGLLIAEFTAPLAAARGPILATAWLWSVLTWSAMGSREVRNDTRLLLFSCAGILPCQFAACFLVGLLTAVLSGVGVALRLAILGDVVGLLAWLAGTLLLPSLALTLGLVSGSSKPFEGLLALLWYASLQGSKGFDLTGSGNGPQTAHFARINLGIAAACLLAGYFFRSAQLHDRWG